MLAKFSSAVIVLVAGVVAGAVDGVVNENRLPQFDPSPAVPPAELTQAARIFPSVSICATGIVTPVGTFVPGEVPVVVFTSSEASVNALAKAVASLVPDPIADGDAIKGAREYTAPTVVNSLMVIKVVALAAARLVHGSSAVIRARFGLPADGDG